MKKILSILSIVAAAVMMTVCVSCKKDEPSPSKSYDFSKMSLELVESLYGQDSATVVNALIEQGFVETYPGINCYINKSYGIEYQLKFENENKRLIYTKGRILYPNKNDREKYLNTEKNIKDKKLPYFVGYLADSNWENTECTDNINYYSENIKVKKCSESIYANKENFYQTEWNDMIEIDACGYYIIYGKSDTDDPFNSYNYAKYGCGYSPRRN